MDSWWKIMWRTVWFRSGKCVEKLVETATFRIRVTNFIVWFVDFAKKLRLVVNNMCIFYIKRKRRYWCIFSTNP